MQATDKNSVVIAELKKLDQFVKELSATCRDYSVKVGIFGNKQQRKMGEVTNPELGAIHEFGLGVPKRSFLRMPLELKSDEIIQQVKTGENWKNLSHGKPVPVLRDLGHACEAIIQMAFDSAGFGQWPRTQYRSAMRKLRKFSPDVQQRQQLIAEDRFEGAHHESPLVDTGQLRRSVTSKVEKNSE